MSKYAGEQVLVVPRPLFDSIGTFQGIRTHGLEAAIDRLLDPENHFFMDREEAEADPTHKQLIPYLVVRSGDRVLCYTRGKSGGESRLHAKMSIGIGGHINDGDAHAEHLNEGAYLRAIERELRHYSREKDEYAAAAELHDKLATQVAAHGENGPAATRLSGVQRRAQHEALLCVRQKLDAYEAAQPEREQAMLRLVARIEELSAR